MKLANNSLHWGHTSHTLPPHCIISCPPNGAISVIQEHSALLCQMCSLNVSVDFGRRMALIKCEEFPILQSKFLDSQISVKLVAVYRFKGTSIDFVAVFFLQA